MRTSRTILLAILPAIWLASPANAHPGSGIVVDRNGNVYFVIAGSSVIMKLTRDGKASVLVGGDPFTIDSAGNVYALATKLDSAVIRITPDGKVTPIARHAKFGGLHFSSMAWGPGGALYLSDDNRVWRIVGDSATAIVPRGVVLSQATGLSVDIAGNIYVADYSTRRIVRLAPDGSVNTPPSLARLALENPTGVTLDDGAIYVLDNPRGGVAVWRVRGDDADLLYWRRTWQVWAGSSLLILFPLLLALQTWVRIPSGRIDWLVWAVLTGAIIVLIYWVAREAFVFSFARHAILAFFAIAALKSYRRVRAARATAPATAR